MGMPVIDGYRVGWPMWKQVARAGGRVRLRVNIRHDADADVFVAESPDLDGLVVEAKSLDDVRTEALAAAGELLELQLHAPAARACTEFTMNEPLPSAA